MLQAAEQIEHLQRIIKRSQQRNSESGIAPWETR
jgi:hypothetical protein